jgi:hypothetical protein
MAKPMSELKYTLLSDGSSDRVLMPILSWALREQGVTLAMTGEWADLRVLRHPPGTLPGRIEAALDLYPCDLLFVHRDAENAEIEERRAEINAAINDVATATVPFVCIVPKRMVEAWLLFSENAIRSASGNPTGAVAIDLPATRRLEEIADPKELLYQLLRTASEHSGRRLRALQVRRLVYRVAELLEGFDNLRILPAFVAFERELRDVVAQAGWDGA